MANIPDNKTMKLIDFKHISSLMFLTLFALVNGLAFGNEKDSESKGLSLTKSDPFELMIEKIPDFQDRVTTCQKPERRKSFNHCLWEGDAALNLNALKPDVKEAINEHLEFKKDKEGKGAKVGDTPLQMTEHVATQKDPAIKSLEDYFSKKLQQALYGDVKKDLTKNVGKQLDKKKLKIVDQRVFHEIYENLVSKKVVADISSYCIRVDYDYRDGFYLLSEEDIEKDTIDDNIKKLSTSLSKPLDSAENHSAQWQGCLGALKETCYDEISPCDNDDDRCDKRLKRSKTKACMVMRSIRSARQALIANKHVMEVYRDTDKMSGSIALENSNSKQVTVRAYDPNNQETSPDKITTFSSGEILSKENEFSATNKKELEKLAECYNEDTGKIIDPKACEGFINTNKDEQYRAVAEVAARSKAVSQQISKMEDEKQIKDFLRKEGRTDDEVTSLIEEYDDINDIRAEIKGRYDKEQEALIEEMAALVEQTTAKGEEIDPVKDEDTIKKIHKELTEREDVFKQMVHYNNVMASFLTIGSDKEDDQEQMRNTGMVIQEMKNSAFNPELNEDSDQNDLNYFTQLTATLEETKSLEANDSDATNILLDVSKINESLLKYDKQRKPADSETD
jgi:hypothetical protein